MKPIFSLLITASVLLTLAAGPDDGPPVKDKPGPYVEVRRDVLDQLNLSDLNLPKCESALKKSGEELLAAADDIKKLREAVKALEKQKQELEAYATQLEAAKDPSRIKKGWETVDGSLGLGIGWALGTAQCVGLAYVFNQPAFRR